MTLDLVSIFKTESYSSVCSLSPEVNGIVLNRQLKFKEFNLY